MPTITGPYFGGRLRVTTREFEVKMSHWICAPKVEDATTGATLLDMTGDTWDLQRVVEVPRGIILVIRKYPGITNDVEVLVEPDGPSYAIGGRRVSATRLRRVLARLP